MVIEFPNMKMYPARQDMRSAFAGRGETAALEDPRCNRPCYGQFPHSLAEFFLQNPLLFIVQTKTKNPELVQ